MRAGFSNFLTPAAIWRILTWSSAGCFVFLGSIGPSESLHAQQSFGVPIQLPTQSVFGVNTTVSVPDGGSISLGGNSGSAWSSIRRGGFGPPFANRALGGTRFASNASLHVQILSQAELEAELLSQLPPGRELADYARPNPPRVFLSETAPLPAVSPDPPSSQPGHSAAKRFATAAPPTATPAAAGRSAATPQSAPSRRTQLVDPNGSRSIQDKADFMSRHIGRKKK
jgi:hypothetical protein